MILEGVHGVWGGGRWPRLYAGSPYLSTEISASPGSYTSSTSLYRAICQLRQLRGLHIFVCRDCRQYRKLRGESSPYQHREPLVQETTRGAIPPNKRMPAGVGEPHKRMRLCRWTCISVLAAEPRSREKCGSSSSTYISRLACQPRNQGRAGHQATTYRPPAVLAAGLSGCVLHAKECI